MIEFRNIYLQFDQKNLFTGFSLTVQKGEKVVFTAASGMGKTSLVKMLLGFMKPDGGEIYYNGIKLNRHTVADVRKDICYISQDASFRNISVAEFINEIFDYKINKHIKHDKPRIHELFSQFDLSQDLLSKQINSLSGGERQRLGFVLCILLDRDIWILDEITAGLDEEKKRAVIEYTLSVEKTVLVISHDKAWREYEDIRKVGW